MQSLSKKFKVVVSWHYNNYRSSAWNYHNYLRDPTINRWTYSYSTCIDQLFANQPKLIINMGIHSSFHDNCQHQVTFGKARLRVDYLPPYKCHVWDSPKASVSGINKATIQFNRRKFFTIILINQQGNLFNSILTFF